MKKTLVPEVDTGIHNRDLNASINRLERGSTYKNLSTIWICPTRGVIKCKVVSSWIGLSRPMNQNVCGPIFFEGDEVGVAYEKAFESILTSPQFKDFKYILTTEEDNIPPSDGLLKLYESIKDYDCVGALYWTKGVDGQPMIYGSPAVMPMNFVPQKPIPETVQPCNGLGMGFNLWKIDSLRKKLKDMPRPWFRTVQERNSAWTQDLFFFFNSAKYGFKVACDTRCKVGHLADDGTVW
jgi:hypothetical protein